MSGCLHSMPSVLVFLRFDIDKLGDYSNNFAIYDTTDTKNLIKQILKEMNLDEKRFPPASIISQISNAKNKLQTPEAYWREASDFFSQQVAKIYVAYQEKRVLIMQWILMIFCF